MEKIPAYKDESLSFEERAKDLVSRMTLEEKISQMQHSAPAIERLGIPSYNWWSEALHGVARAGVATVFPQAIGMAATFDEELLQKIGDVVSTEGRAKYHEFQRKGDHDIYKGLTFWAPNVNIDRDPRWGRGQETYGEDPYLTSRLGVAYIKGIQGDDPKYLKAAACAKHFAVHSGPEAERHSFNAVVSQKDLWETYLPAFEAAVLEGDVAGVMGAYNRTNGEPCCGSKTLLLDILRKEWGFKGYTTSDCWAIKDFNENHKVTGSIEESAALAVKNGCDLNCGCAYASLMKAYNQGLIEEKDIDLAVYHLMLIRMRLGMFDDPKHVPFASIPYEANDCEEHKKFSLEVSKKSLVLLKNRDNFLPLDRKKIHSIAVIGPNADSHAALEGNYNGTASEYVTVLEGIREAVEPGTRVYFAEGCHLYKNSVSGLGEKYDRFAEAISAAEHADVAVVCLGLDASIEGEEGDTSNEFASGDKLNLKLPGTQEALLEEITKTGTPVILVLMTGSAMAITWADEHVDAIVQAWYPGAQGGRAIASLIFGDYSPSGRLPVTFYRTDEDLPDFKDYAMENRTYRFFKGVPLYPFGYGLSYTRFEYSKPVLAKDTITAGSDLEVRATVKNVGKMESDEIVQMYLKDVEASVRVPNWQLAGFRRVHLKPGESVEVAFTLKARQMALIDDNGNCVLEPGLFRVAVGGSQPDARSAELLGTEVPVAEFTVTGDPLPMKR
ncbi:glycoside hydrolase family 3 C-terminal domain-containing protein [Thermocaproicibacter melissae]|uniref:glycoside hydrolase family 3 C-terminal domain-containing protein n=1 Tax=Thermocaproicibacter melissae TaxID=2966552 RepID=UPI0024B09B42|nr:glycoside hydrolase family 3 C-terminal domain-containing protein [Thermocaproicibacter melissae]WBY63589.1 glycoside hydrolase family 3 C-terminal domain-containing protein [Thermocaproicibacter melissae]